MKIISNCGIIIINMDDNQCTEGTTNEIQHVFWIIQFILRRAISGEINKLFYVPITEKQIQKIVVRGVSLMKIISTCEIIIINMDQIREIFTVGI